MAGLLELCVVKATCTVLRGGDVSDDISLPDRSYLRNAEQDNPVEV